MILMMHFKHGRQKADKWQKEGRALGFICVKFILSRIFQEALDTDRSGVFVFVTILSKGKKVVMWNLFPKGGDSMTILISVEKAKEEIVKLKLYIELVETYKADTLDKFIIKEYASTNSIDKTVIAVNAAGYAIDHKEVERDYVVSLLKKRGKDDLHKLVRSAYMEKTKYKRAVERRTMQRNSTL
jgi:hypothetical protein